MDKTHLDPGRTPPRPPDTAATGVETRANPAARFPDEAPDTDPLHDIRILGEYRILRRLGEGGMGAVYLGYEGQHGRMVALKVLVDGLLANQNYVDRFFREARSGAQLNHSNIVRTYAAGQDGATGKYYLVLEFVDGPSAAALLARDSRLSVGDAVYLTLHIARALEHAHSRNIVHRDIKPDNILITRSGVAKLGDLGLAKRTDELSHLTAARQGFGTTAYMPYEQAISARRADARSDIYALGATLYHLLTGEVPFPGDNHLEIIDKKNGGVFLPAREFEKSVPIVLDNILAKMMARQPSDRYQTATDLIVDLERSRLAATVPSFADANLARQDPWFQAHLSPTQPTRLDPGIVPVVQSAHGPSWIVRYNNQAGRAFIARLTTEQIVRRLDEGTLPRDALVQTPDSEKPVAVCDLDEVRLLLGESTSPAEADDNPSAPSDPELNLDAISAECDTEDHDDGDLTEEVDSELANGSSFALADWQTFLTLAGCGAVAAAVLFFLARWLLFR